MATLLVQPVICPVLVGRTAFLETLLHLLEQVKDNGRLFGTAVISGEAGIGKSRLVAEVKAWAARRGFHVLQGDCFEPDQALPYAPLLDLLRFFCTTRSPEEIAQEFGPAAPGLARLLPELSTWLPGLAPVAALPNPEQEKHRLFQALSHFFSRLAARQPHLLVFEDLHWSDDTSLEFLLHLARHARPLPLFLLLTCRSDQSLPALDRFLAELARRRLATELALLPLSRSEVNRMIAAIFDLPRPVQAEFLEALYALTEGNPFFVEEVLKALLVTGQIFYTDGRWERKSAGELQIPRTVQVAVERRVEQLSPAAREALALAAVAGRRFNFSLLQGLLQRDERELLALLKEMIAAQLVVEESADQFAFRHALTREAVYASLLARERQALHGLVAETVERLYANSPEMVVADLAGHYYEAGVWQKALEYARRAGEKAQALHTPRATVTQFTRALEAAHVLNISPPASLYQGRGQAYETLGDFEAAQADYTAALQIAQDEGQARDEWQAHLSLGLLWASRDYRLADDYFQRALVLAQHMEEPAMVAHTLNRLGNWQLNVGRPLAAINHHQEALAGFEQLDEQQGLADTLDLLGIATTLSGNLIKARSYFEQAVSLQRKLGDRQGLASTLSSLSAHGGIYESDTLVAAISLPEAAAYAESGLQIAREIGWRAGEAYALGCLVCSLGPQGEYGRTLELAQEALHVAVEIKHRQWMVSAHCNLGLLHLDLLAGAAAQAHLEEAFSLARETGSFLWIHETAAMLAVAHLRQKQFAQAETLLNDYLEPAAVIQPDLEPPILIPMRMLWAARAELALAQRQPRAALDIVEQLIALAPNASKKRQGTIPRLEILQGKALAALNRLKEAEAALLAAQAAASYRNSRALLWRIHAHLGHLYRRQRHKDAAGEQFAAARALIKSLAAAIPNESLRRHFQQKALATIPDASPLTPRQAARKQFEGLTPRECDVAALISQGLTNQEIAEQLVLSQRTVEKHVSHILSKLHFTSRAQIAAWAVQKRLKSRDYAN
ncbi:MAG: AAA family ATPase [Chloroflexi bacterium]|nr:AAA family ATPase [Chloroflexota bacterium]MCI0579713.1 AAA family ATPase [Chloroflexota bacterium]MCI0644146.1 AAA family ATPase [Chloroflexota bacterium]MCI0726236.1 AAA family ATPase [Chloroflexota bacterium]